MPPIDVVLDTNVVIAALRSRHGASFRVLSLSGDPRFRWFSLPALRLCVRPICRSLGMQTGMGRGL